MEGLNSIQPGLVSLVQGDGDIGSYLDSHPGVDMCAFTGSTATGTKILQAASQSLKPVVLECGAGSGALAAQLAARRLVVEFTPLTTRAYRWELQRKMERGPAYDDQFETVSDETAAEAKPAVQLLTVSGPLEGDEERLNARLGLSLIHI